MQAVADSTLCYGPKSGKGRNGRCLFGNFENPVEPVRRARGIVSASLKKKRLCESVRRSPKGSLFSLETSSKCVMIAAPLISPV